MDKIVFTGCSFTAGNGWVDCDPIRSRCIHDTNDQRLWTNLVRMNIPDFCQLDYINLGQGGISNTEIFQNTVDAISNYGSAIKTIFCQWTAMPRYSFHAGLESWTTLEHIDHLPDMIPSHDIILSSGDHIKRKYLEDIKNRFFALHHLHWEILKVVSYCNILKKLAEHFGADIFFINGLCPWDKDYFVRQDNTLPESYTMFTKTAILNIDSRSDYDINNLYQKIHNDYDNQGGIQAQNWINLDTSFHQIQTDTNYDHHHPGETSNKNFFSIIKNHLNSQTKIIDSV